MAHDDDESESPATLQEGQQRKTPRTLQKEISRGELVGRYAVMEPLGQGGMGVVYAALDPELGRRVALKFVKLGGSGDSQTRLLREAQAMARLSHPNVVHVYDVGTHGRRVFLAMELVEGETLRTWLRAEKRPWRDVVRMFRDVGRGLAAAHEAGIVHRDFKLDNVLVDSKGRARVTDFGLASLGDDDPLDGGASGSLPASVSPLGSDLTRTGAVMGTPAYMAPEQAKAEGADARADEFSFCVSFYEALYGQRPFDREGTLRPTPTEPRVPGWIRRILLRGLAVDPDARWPSMSDLLTALDRDPANKWRWIGAAIGVAVVLGVAVFVLRPTHTAAPVCEDTELAFGTTWDAAQREAVKTAFGRSDKKFASDAFATTANLLDQTASAWKAERRNACLATKIQNTQTEEAMLLRMACLEQQRGELAGLVGLLRTADDKIIELAVQAASRLSQPEECRDVHSLALTAKPPDDPVTKAEIEKLRLELASGSALASTGKPADALATYQPIAARAAELGYRPLEAEALFALALVHVAQGDHKTAYDTLRKAMAAAEAGRMDRLAVRISINLMTIAAFMHQFKEAEDWSVRAQSLLERLGGDKRREADLAYSRGLFAGERGHDEQAVIQLSIAATQRLELLGPDHTDTLMARLNLGAYYDELARAEDAIREDEAAIAGFDRTLGPHHPRAIVAIANLGLVYLRTGRVADAERHLQRAHELSLATLGPRSRKTAIAEYFLSELRLHQERYADAIALARHCGEIYAEVSGETGDDVGLALIAEGDARARAGDPAAAIPLIERGLEIRQAIKPDAPALAGSLTVLGDALIAAKRAPEALPHLERALTFSEQRARYPSELARTYLAMSRALTATRGDQARADELATKARAMLSPTPR